MMIEPLSQQHALEIAKDWHYEAPYDLGRKIFHDKVQNFLQK